MIPIPLQVFHPLFYLLNLASSLDTPTTLGHYLLIIAMNQIVKANDLHGRELFELLPVDV